MENRAFVKGCFDARDGVKLEDIKHGQCRWPHGEGESYRYCGEPVDGKRTYCKHHASIAYEGKPFVAMNHYTHIMALQKNVALKLPGEGL